MQSIWILSWPFPNSKLSIRITFYGRPQYLFHVVHWQEKFQINGEELKDSGTTPGLHQGTLYDNSCYDSYY